MEYSYVESAFKLSSEVSPINLWCSLVQLTLYQLRYYHSNTECWRWVLG